MINKFYDRIFVINLKDAVKRYNKMLARLTKYGIKYEVFPAVDGRVKEKDYAKKRRELEEMYNVKIAKKLNPPAASLVIGTIEILRKMVKNKWKRILIFEDDCIPTRNFHKRFEEGVAEIKEDNINFDMLYLGAGHLAGHRGMSYTKTSKIKHITPLSIIDKDEFNWYVQNKNDLREPCDEDYCSTLSENLSVGPSVGGTWCYSYTLNGAKKLLKLLNNMVTNHIDQILIQQVENGKMNAIAFDPPIVYHEEGLVRSDSNIPWSF